MNVLLWILQFLLALHTIIGALWKFSNSEQVVESLHMIPHSIWMAMSVMELLCSLGLILAIFNTSMGKLVPIAAIFIATEMLFISGVHLYSGAPNYSPIIYWLVVAALCGFIAYGRYALKPITQG